jgi:L-alanine-DL-glutamate epimerase-like enolase superfamily enzyme
MKNGILLKQGRVFAPNRPGLGIEVDWENLDKADFYVRSE